MNLKSKKSFWTPQAVVLCFYLLNLINLLQLLQEFYFRDMSSILYTGRFPFHFLSPTFPINTALPIVSILLMTFLVVSFPFLPLRTVRFGWFVISLIVGGFSFSADNGHNRHLFPLLSFYLIFPKWDSDDTKHSKAWPSALWFCQLQILLIYALSGYWKLVGLIKGLRDANMVSSLDFLSYAIAKQFMETNIRSPVSDFIASFPKIACGLSLSVVVFQCASLFVVLRPALFPAWGILLCLFHLATLAAINVFFCWPIVLCLLFLFCYRIPDSLFTKYSTPLGPLRIIK